MKIMAQKNGDNKQFLVILQYSVLSDFLCFESKKYAWDKLESV